MTAIIAFIGAIFPTLAGWINLAISFFQKKAADQAAANSAEQNAEAVHQSDGAQSVDDKESADAQNEALDEIKNQLSNPTPVVVHPPEAKP